MPPLTTKHSNGGKSKRNIFGKPLRAPSPGAFLKPPTPKITGQDYFNYRAVTPNRKELDALLARETLPTETVKDRDFFKLRNARPTRRELIDLSIKPLTKKTPSVGPRETFAKLPGITRKEGRPLRIGTPPDTDINLHRAAVLPKIRPGHGLA